MTCELCQLCAASSAAGAVWRNADLSVVLVDDAAYPGFCRVIWNGHVKEMSDLTAAQRAQLMEAVWQVELAMRDVMTPDKVNLASLGNMTPHLHWHVIPRYRDDAHFPHPVWAPLQRKTAPSALAARTALLAPLRAAIVMRMGA